MIARQGASFTAPTAKHLTDSEGNPASADFVWVGDDGNTYAPGSTVPGNVRMLVARWSEDSIGMPPSLIWTKTAGCRAVLPIPS